MPERCGRFKLIPSIVEGPFIVKKAVGNKPALLGRKLRQRYFRGPNYVETDVGESWWSGRAQPLHETRDKSSRPRESIRPRG